ncbi:50S ribosomal protein L21 [Proteiniphilum saccharofermentans]|uniref:Large ribosomal subunit protein bL21 n=2 Tax=Proteiniphilum saccharofermentans TaxID=1642647 RepID=A0A1R3T4D7_9BACT|nr:50S ribosomal protein L21 [Proteiniphilum saccharofermentans]
MARLRHVTSGYFNMYVIVDIQGQQFKVEQDQKLFVHRINADQGAEVEFEKVMLVDKDGAVTVGAPVIDGAKVVVEVLSHVKGDKVLVFKKKRRKGYRKLNGHRQQFSEVRVKEIIA